MDLPTYSPLHSLHTAQRVHCLCTGPLAQDLGFASLPWEQPEDDSAVTDGWGRMAGRQRREQTSWAATDVQTPQTEQARAGQGRVTSGLGARGGGRHGGLREGWGRCEGRTRSSPLRGKLGEGEPLRPAVGEVDPARQATPHSHPRCHRRAQQEQLLETPGPGARLLRAALLLLARQAPPPPFLTSPPGGAAARLVGARGRHSPEAGRPGPRATNHSVFISAHRLLHRPGG